MQEEVENRTVNLAISTTKLTARSIVRLGLKGIAYIKRKSQEAAMKNEKPTGKQTIQELIGQNQGVTNIDISKTDLKGFEKYARKYGVDYAITKDKSVLPPKYLVFFKAKALEIEPGNAEAVYWMIYALIKIGSVQSAQAEYDRAKQMLPEPAYKELNVKLAEEKIHLK